MRRVLIVPADDGSKALPRAIALVTALGVTLAACESKDDRRDQRDGGAGSAGSDAPDAAADAAVDAGAVAGSGGMDGGACPPWEGCLGGGGRGNVCGGVIADERFLTGTGFDDFEGARVVGVEGHAVIEGGNFTLHLGSFAGCGNFSATYRIDVSPNGRCDDDTDLVYVSEEAGVVGIDPVVTGDEPGTKASCAAFPGQGHDLDLILAPDCHPTCGGLRIGLFDVDDPPTSMTRLAATMLYFDGRWMVGRGFGAALTAGRDYRVAYHTTACSGATDSYWDQTFTAEASVNTIELDVSAAPTRGECF